jgi:hypothetical protein
LPRTQSRRQSRRTWRRFVDSNCWVFSLPAGAVFSGATGRALFRHPSFLRANPCQWAGRADAAIPSVRIGASRKAGPRKLAFPRRARSKRITVGLGFRSADGAWRTIEGYEAMNAIRNGQIRWVAKGDAIGQLQFIHTLFGIAVRSIGNSPSPKRDLAAFTAETPTSPLVRARNLEPRLHPGFDKSSSDKSAFDCRRPRPFWIIPAHQSLWLCSFLV